MVEEKDKPKPDELAALSSSASSSPGDPSPEDSGDGMLDLRALAASATPSLSAAASAREDAADSRVDLKTGLDNAQTLEVPLSAVVSTPSTPSSSQLPAALAAEASSTAPGKVVAAPAVRRAWGVVAVIVVALAALGVYALSQEPAADAEVAEPVSIVPLEAVNVPVSSAPPPLAVPADPTPVAPPEPGGMPEPASAGGMPEPPTGSASERSTLGRASERARSDREPAAPSSSTTSEPVRRPAVDPISPSDPEPPIAPSPSESDPTDRLTSVIDQALGAAPTKAPANVVPQELPETPSRTDVTRALGRLLPGIQQCAGDQVGLAPATLLVKNDGTVVSVAVGGSPFGATPQGRCMEGVIKGATFPRFKQTNFRITYPFSIRPTTQ